MPLQIFLLDLLDFLKSGDRQYLIEEKNYHIVVIHQDLNKENLQSFYNTIYLAFFVCMMTFTTFS